MKPHDYVAIILAFTVCFVVVGVYVGTWVRGEPLSMERVEAIDNLFTGMIAILAHYVGTKQATGANHD